MKAKGMDLGDGRVRQGHRPSPHSFAADARATRPCEAGREAPRRKRVAAIKYLYKPLLDFAVYVPLLLRALGKRGDNVALSRRQYLIIRLALWAIAVFIALLPTIMTVDDLGMLRDAGAFRNLLFVTVPVSALGLAATFDYLCTGYPSLGASAFFNSIGSLILNGVGLTTGLAGFVNIRQGPLSKGQLWTYSILICVAVITSLVTEIAISLNHRGLVQNPGSTLPPAGPDRNTP